MPNSKKAQYAKWAPLLPRVFAAEGGRTILKINEHNQNSLN